MNHFGRINGHGDRYEYHWGAVNADANARAYSLMYHKLGGAAGEVVVNGHADAGEFAGVNMAMPAEPISTTTLESMTAAGLKAMNLTLALPPARINVWAQPNSTFVEGGKVIANGSDQVKPLPVGSTAQVIGVAKEGKAVGANSELIQIELVAPATAEGLQTISCFGVDAAVDGTFLSVTWSNHAGTVQGLYGPAPADGIKVKNLVAKLKTAAGAGKGVTYTVMRSTNGGASFATTTLDVTVDEANTKSVNNDLADVVTLNQGDILGLRVNNKAATDVGAAAGSNVSFQVG